MGVLRTILKSLKSSLFPTADASSWYCGVVLLALILLAGLVRDEENKQLRPPCPCDEIYVVREGETLNTISDKCGDPFIVERNPHIQDPDDVFPGLVIKITPNPATF